MSPAVRAHINASGLSGRDIRDRPPSRHVPVVVAVKSRPSRSRVRVDVPRRIQTCRCKYGSQRQSRRGCRKASCAVTLYSRSHSRIDAEIGLGIAVSHWPGRPATHRHAKPCCRKILICVSSQGLLFPTMLLDALGLTPSEWAIQGRQEKAPNPRLFASRSPAR